MSTCRFKLLKKILRAPGNAERMVKSGALTWQAISACDLYTDDERRAGRIGMDALRAAGIPEPSRVPDPKPARKTYGTDEMLNALEHNLAIENDNE